MTAVSEDRKLVTRINAGAGVAHFLNKEGVSEAATAALFAEPF